MYKKTSPQQKLFGIETQVSPSLHARLESSWAHLFRYEVLPILFRKEDDYAVLYGTTGRPNFSVARLLGLCLLQEWNDLSDQEALDTFSFDVRWRYALDNRARLADDVVGRDRFCFDAEGLVTACPMGHKPVDHRILSAHNTTDRSLHAVFDGDTCRSCTMLDQCPVRAPNHRTKGCQPRETTGDFRLEITCGLRLRDEMYALQQTPEWKDRYRIRSGIEATHSELKRAHGIGRLRVRRLAKICFAVACKLIACNIKRWARAWRTSKRTVEEFVSSVCFGLKLFLFHLVGLAIVKKQIFTTMGRVEWPQAFPGMTLTSQGSIFKFMKGKISAG